MSKFPAMIFGTMCILAPASANAQSNRSPEALALLRGVEQSRTQHKQIKFNLQVDMQQYTGHDPKVMEYVIEWTEQRQRFEILRGQHDQAQVVLIEGGKAYVLRRSRHADICIYDLKDALDRRGLITFDPRALGLMGKPSPSGTWRELLWYDSISSLVTEGDDIVHGVNVRRIKAVSEPNKSTSTFWIEEPSFRVHRRRVESAQIDEETESWYSPLDLKSPYPERVQTTRTDRHPQGISWKINWRLSNLDTGTPISPTRFTVAAMDVPVGTPLSDYRINRIVGYWDGQNVSPEPVGPVVHSESASGEATNSERSWGAIILGAIVVLSLALLVVWWRRRLPSG